MGWIVARREFFATNGLVATIGGVPEDRIPTRQRIIRAARGEFAERGLAGARVDRIARRAEANKQRLYAYFGSKEQLFDAVVRASVSRILDAVPFDAAALPDYAVALAEHYLSDPELVPLLLWHSLERPGVLWRLPESRGSQQEKIDAVGAAQDAGLVAGGIPADEVVEMILGLVIALVIRPIEEGTWPRRRETLRVAVARLVAPLPPPL